MNIFQFNFQYELVNGLLDNGQFGVSSEASKIAVSEYFMNNEGSFGIQEEEEFIIQSFLQFPGSPSYAPPSLQRLFANVSGNEYRIATSFSSVQL